MNFFENHLKGCMPSSPCTRCKLYRALFEIDNYGVREKIIKLIGQAHDGEPKDEALELPIDSLGFSTRVRLSLLNDGIKTLGDLTKKNEVELLLIPNFGRCSLNEVKEALAQKGLFFVPRT